MNTLFDTVDEAKVNIINKIVNLDNNNFTVQSLYKIDGYLECLKDLSKINKQ